jgi:hypothetical protein
MNEERRKSDRRISPAIGEFAIQEREKLLARIAELEGRGMHGSEREAFEASYAVEYSRVRGATYTAEDIAVMREGDGYGDRAYLNGQWKGWQARAAITAQQGASVAVPDLVEAVLEAFAAYERFGEDCTFEAMPMIHASVLDELAEVARAQQPAPSPVSGLVEALERITKTPFNWRESGARAMGNIALDALAAYKAEGGEA